MNYDIGIGRCADIDANIIGVKLDSVMVSRLLPDQPWRKSGTSMLRINSSVCSSKRPPEVGAEVYLDRAALSTDSAGSLDLAGDGRDGAGEAAPPASRSGSGAVAGTDHEEPFDPSESRQARLIRPARRTRSLGRRVAFPLFQ